MPRKIGIKRHPNPTHLSMEDRRLAIEVLQSLEKSVHVKREKIINEQRRWWHGKDPWTLDEEQQLRQQVYRAAIKQLQGAQKSEGNIFKLEREVPEADMAYVLESLGRSG